MKRIFTYCLLLCCLGLTAAAQQTKRLVVLHTSDVHSRVEPIDPLAADRNAGMGGMVRRATFLKDFRAEHPDALLFDCGDFSQGTPYYNLFQGEVEVKMMNLMAYDAVAIGNHEFDFGLENMARLFRMARFPVVCANYEVSGTVLEGLVKPYVVLNRGGVKVGVFGLSPQLEGLVQADKCEGIVYNDPIRVAKEMVERLRTVEGCDVVICLSHLGLRGRKGASDEKLVAETQGIDAILGGHSHTFMKAPSIYLNAVGKDVPVLHTGGSGVFVGELNLTLTKE